MKIPATRYIARLALLISITLAVELIGLPQPVTGPYINLMLIFVTLELGLFAGIMLGIITPAAALLRGQLPAVLMPVVPFIVVGNAVLVAIFYCMGCKNLSAKNVAKNPLTWFALLFAALSKFIWLSITVKISFPQLFKVALPDVFITMMSFPQLINAIIGGAFAILIYVSLLKKEIIDTKNASGKSS